MTRLEAIQYIIGGGSILIECTGKEVVNARPHTFRIKVRTMLDGSILAVIDCDAMRREYNVRMTARNLLAFIRLHYKTSFYYNDIVPESAAA